MTSALNLAEQGFPVHVLEATDKLGGNAWRLTHTLKREDVQPFLEQLVGEDHVP